MSAAKGAANKRFEWLEIKTDLASEKRERKKDALKKLISLMTIGKDVSSLFTDVVNCIQSDRLEIKKLVYLYLMNYAKTKPELALLAVNTFIKDTEDPNPLIKALALRTMGCIHVDKIIEYITTPLERCLKDEDPYVRKTAAICVAKLHALNPQLVLDMGFLKMLSDLLSDGNPMVVANAVATFSEIINRTPAASKFFEMDSSNINKLLTALNECTEWGQIFILDSIVSYNTDNQQELKSICERVSPRLSHANSAVVLSATKVLLKFVSRVENDEPFIFTIFKKMSPPLVTLLSLQPEIQYVALRNINLITQKFPKILANEIRAFFIKYNDPIYVKLEKLEIMIRLVTIETVDLVLNELREYATEVDVDFVRKSVRAIGRCALKVEVASESCVATLEDLIETKVNYVVQESIIVIKDILRKYPNKYEGVIAKLSESLDSLDDPEARASMIWILGEYCDRIDHSADILASFMEGFFDESTVVQLQLLTAVVKLFLKNPVDTQELVQRMLTMVTQECGNPDLRDRGFVYWRLLSTDPNSARDIVLSQKEQILEETTNLDAEFLDELLLNLSTLSSIYHKTPHTFIHGSLWKKTAGVKNQDMGAGDLDEDEATFFEDEDTAGRSDGDVSKSNSQLAGQAAPDATKNIANDLLLLDLDDVPSSSVAADPPAHSGAGGHFNAYANSMNDLTSAGFDSSNYGNFQMSNMGGFQTHDLMFGSDMGGGFGSLMVAQPQLYSPPKVTLLDAAVGQGVELRGSFSFRSGMPFFDLTINNTAMAVLSGLSLLINKNAFGISVSAGAIFPSSLGPMQAYDVSIPLNFNGQIASSDSVNQLQCAFLSNLGTLTFVVDFPLHFLVHSQPSSSLDAHSFPSVFAKFPASADGSLTFQVSPGTKSESLISKLKVNHFSIANITPMGGKEVIQCYCALLNNTGIVIEVGFTPSTLAVEISCKSTLPAICPVMARTLQQILVA